MYISPFGLLFDMDGVIVDSNPLHVECLVEFFEKYDKKLSDQEMQEHIFGRRNEEWLRYVFGEDLSKEKIEQYTEEKEQMFRDRAGDMPEVAGLTEFLEEMKRHRIPMVVATSAPKKNMDFILDKLKIRKYFKDFVWSEHVEEGKPHPQVYHLAAEKIGLKNEHCFVLEDSTSGVEAGYKSGSKVIAVTTTHKAEEFDNISLAIENFQELDFEKLKSLMDNA
jgi:HAD superfamily hydrolase (TIGR01509 family)